MIKTERNEKIIQMYVDGITMWDIGIMYKISDARVWQIIKKHYNNLDLSKRHDKKRATVKRATKSELFVYEKLKELNINFEPTVWNDYYDIDIGDKKVEIKHRSKPDKTFYKVKDKEKYKGYTELYKFNYLTPKHPVDYFIFVCGELDKDTKFYIYPADILKDNLSIQVNPTHGRQLKNLKYLENWEVFK